MKAWAAEGGKILIKGSQSRAAQRQMYVGYVVGCRGGGKIVIKGMFLIKRNVVESMGCRGGKILIKRSQVGPHKGKCVSAMLWAAEGGENCDKRM